MIEQALGPLFVDVAGCELLPEECEKLIHPLIGGVILFSRNFDSPAQLNSLVRHIKSLRTPGLLVAVDQEGGRVQRFKAGFTVLPPANTYGELYDRDQGAGLEAARCAGFLIASELRALGVDISFAPVLDVRTVESTVIGDRAFHSDPIAVAELARAYIEGMNRGGMRATGKHFPGHGGVAGDSHTSLPCDFRRWDQIDRCDLVPYRKLVNLLHGIMTAHVSFPEINDRLPTYSSYWLQKVLRRDIGYSGVIFSDDLSMDGAKTGGEPEDRVSSALAAGCDMALICNDPAAVERVLERIGLSAPAFTPPNLLALAGGPVDNSFGLIARQTLEPLGVELA